MGDKDHVSRWGHMSAIHSQESMGGLSLSPGSMWSGQALPCPAHEVAPHTCQVLGMDPCQPVKLHQGVRLDPVRQQLTAYWGPAGSDPQQHH